MVVLHTDDVVTYAEGLEEILGLGVNLKLTALTLGEVQSRDLWDVLILALTLLLLKLEGDTTDWTTLNTLHQMGGVTSNLQHHKLAQFPTSQSTNSCSSYFLLAASPLFY